MFEEIPRNIDGDYGEILLKIPGNVREDSGGCSRRFREMLMKITRNVDEDYGKCY